MSAAAKCPICGKLGARETRPFCSKRCADVDLGRWLTGRYVVPGEDGEADGVLANAPDDDDDDEQPSS